MSLVGGTDITNFVTFLNTGGVQIGDEDTDVSLFSGGFQSTASETTLAGVVRTEGGAVTLDDVILADNTTLQTSYNTPAGANVMILGTVDSAPLSNYDFDILSGTAGSTTIVGNVGDTDELGAFYVYGSDINLHDVSTAGEQSYETAGGSGDIQFNSTYQTQGADITTLGNLIVADNATMDTTWGGAYQTGNIWLRNTSNDITFNQANGTLTLISGGSTIVEATIAGLINEFNSLTVWARENVTLFGGTLGEDLEVHAGAFDGDLEHTPNGNITFNNTTTVIDTATMTATGDIEFLGEFNVYSLIMQLNGHAQSYVFSPVNIGDNFSIGGLTIGMGTIDLVGSIRGVDSDQAASFGLQLEQERRDDLLFNSCIVEVGCLNFDPSAIIIPVFDPVIYLYEREGTDSELRYSDLPNTEIWYRLGGAPDIWEERLGESEERRRNREGGDDEGSQEENGQ